MAEDKKTSDLAIRTFFTQQRAALGVMLGQLDDPDKAEF